MQVEEQLQSSAVWNQFDLQLENKMFLSDVPLVLFQLNS